jgi:hypothetical protein
LCGVVVEDGVNELGGGHAGLDPVEDLDTPSSLFWVGLVLNFPDHGELRRRPGLQHRTVPDPDPRDGRWHRIYLRQRRGPHGVHMAPDDTMLLTDDGGHFVRKVTLDGKVLLELGVLGKPAPFMSGEPFYRCTHTALSPKGEIYVSDGYGNARVHKYSPQAASGAALI